MKRFLTITVAVLLMAAVAAPALAWEFSMTGQWEYRMRYLARTGNVDLFGLASLQNGVGAAGIVGSTPVGFAGPNIYNRGTPSGGTGAGAPAVGAFVADSAAGLYRIVKGGYSQYESDAFWTDSRLTFVPEVRVNPAIRVHGVYTVGGYRHKYWQNNANAGVLQGTVFAPPFERYYMSQTSMNAYDTAAVGSWEQFRATIQLPIGIWSLGVKDFPFGTGATLGYNTRAEAFLTVVPYGPFRFMHGIWLSRGFAESWGTNPDAGTRNPFMQGVLFTYDSGPLNMGAGYILQYQHRDMANSAPFPVAGAPTPAFSDRNFQFYLVYMKYNNGRFFTNAEYAWATLDTYRGAPMVAGAPVPVAGALGYWGPSFAELNHFWWEVGAFAGPAKVSLLYSIASGPVNNRVYAGFTQGNGNFTKLNLGAPINYQAMEPYEFLMFNTYGGGNNGGWAPTDFGFVADDHGQMSDAYCLAGRVDYAVASNLNVFGSYIWAHRLERAGTWKGQFLSTGATATALQRQAFVNDNFGASGEVGGNVNPFVDDGHIGWEANVGFAWKLLEGFNFNCRYSYWQPGRYFDQAIQGVGFTPGGGGIRSDAAVVQSKDAIQAITGSMVIDF